MPPRSDLSGGRSEMSFPTGNTVQNANAYDHCDCGSVDDVASERFPIKRGHLIKKESLKTEKLERSLIEKIWQTFPNLI